MAIQYVIRSFEFAYNDEYYLTNEGNLGSIDSTYDNLDEAEAALKKLNAQALRAGIDSDLCNYQPFCEDPDDLIEQLNQFCLARCGQPFDLNNFPDGLSDDDVCEIAKMTGLEAYRLITVDTAQTYYAIWMNVPHPFTQELHYLCDYGGTKFFSQSLDEMISENDVDYALRDLFPEKLQGDLSELSDSPQILANLIEQNPLYFGYENNELKINKKRYDSLEKLFSVNALLKNPIFEIRELTFEQASKL